MQRKNKNLKNKTRKQKTKVKSDNNDYTTALLVVGGNVYELKKTRRNLKGGVLSDLLHQQTMYDKAQVYVADIGNTVKDTAVTVGTNTAYTIKNIGSIFNKNVGEPVTNFVRNKINPPSIIP